MVKQHMFEQVADEITEWIERMATEVADALMENGKAPFAGSATEAQKLEYYDKQFFNPDGTPNIQGRQKTLERVGVAGFAEVMNAVMKQRGMIAATTTAPGQGA